MYMPVQNPIHHFITIMVLYTASQEVSIQTFISFNLIPIFTHDLLFENMNIATALLLYKMSIIRNTQEWINLSY